MRIGIDVSQTAFEQSGVANYLINLISHLVSDDGKNQFVLFFSSLRQNPPQAIVDLSNRKNVTLKTVKIPPTVLEVLWNRLHKIPIEKFIGDVDIFITSDWTEPPARKAKKATILYDLIVYKYPKESHNKVKISPLKLLISPNIVMAQRRKIRWVRKESEAIFCISESTKKDASEILNIDKNKLHVLYPGV